MIRTTDECFCYLEKILSFLRSCYHEMEDIEQTRVDEIIDDIIEVINR